MSIVVKGGDNPIKDWRSWRPSEFSAGQSAATYFDYYYSGCDINVHISDMPENMRTLPIVAIGFNMTQQKVPIFGFWDYTFSAVALGTRIVQGTFAIPFRGPQYMYYILAEAADKYDAQNDLPRIPLSEDDANLEKYWGKTRDEKQPGVKHIFLSHPPFDIIVSYGQESYPPDQYYDIFTNSSELQQAGDEVYYDINERFLNPDDTKTRPRIFIEQCHLTTMGMQMEPTGQPLMEAYTFFARDIYWEGQEDFRKD